MTYSASFKGGSPLVVGTGDNFFFIQGEMLNPLPYYTTFTKNILCETSDDWSSTDRKDSRC